MGSPIWKKKGKQKKGNDFCCYLVICIQRAFLPEPLTKCSSREHACRCVFLWSHSSPVLRGLGGHVSCHCRIITQTGRCFSKWKIAVKINYDSSAENSKQKLHDIFSAFAGENRASINNPANKTGWHDAWDGRQQLPHMPAYICATPKPQQWLCELSALTGYWCCSDERTSALAGGAGRRWGTDPW